MKGLGIYASALALTMDAMNNPQPRKYEKVKSPKTKKLRAVRSKNKKAKVARKKGRK